MFKKNKSGGNSSRKAAKNKNIITKHNQVPQPDDKTTFLCKTIKIDGKIVNVVDHTDKAIKARIPGSFLNRVWIRAEDYLLVQYDDDIKQYFVLYKYNKGEIKEFVQKIEHDNIFESAHDANNNTKDNDENQEENLEINFDLL